ncbi:T9SS type A sorting domain-containing protein [candidate division KSB1 bacterium]|nr:T9SS type A sorting domain-containing protein [candidate division KSB1 bacterium]
MTLRAMFVIALTVISSRLAVARPDTLWSALPDLTGNSVFYGATACANGDFVLVGSIDDGEASSQDMLIVRLADNGEVLWTTRPTSGFEDVDQASSVVELPSGELRVVGWSANSYTLNVLDVDSEGNVIHVWSYETPGGRTKGMDIALWPGGDLGVVGYGYGGIGMGSDAWTMRKSATGDTLWSMMEHSSGIDAAISIEFRDDYFVTAGYDQAETNGEYDLYVSKFDTALAWGSGQRIELDGDQLAYAAAIGAAGDVYVGGREAAVPFLAKTDPELNLIWSRSDYFASGMTGHLRGVAMYGGDQPICAGWVEIAGDRQCLIMLADSHGDSLWSWTPNLGDSSGFWGIEGLNCSGYLVYGFANEGGTSRAFALRLAPEQGVLGVVRNAHGDALSGIRVRAVGESCTAVSTADGRFVLGLAAGQHRLIYSGNCIDTDTTAWITVAADSLLAYAITAHEPAIGSLPTSINLIAYNHVTAGGTLTLRNDGDGDLSYSIAVEMFNPGPDEAWLSVDPPVGSIAPLQTETVQITVTADTTDDGVFEFYGRLTVRTNTCPDTVAEIPVFVTVLDAETEPGLAGEFAVSEVYPNPFNGITTLELTLPRAADVALRVFDVVGRTVRELRHEGMSAGNHRLEIDLGDFATGVYFMRVRAGEYIAVRKLLLTK